MWFLFEIEYIDLVSLVTLIFQLTTLKKIFFFSIKEFQFSMIKVKKEKKEDSISHLLKFLILSIKYTVEFSSSTFKL